MKTTPVGSPLRAITRGVPPVRGLGAEQFEHAWVGQEAEGDGEVSVNVVVVDPRAAEDGLIGILRSASLACS